ncbi:hypothetical protein GIB67_039860 [Kingdonia uniflora]|uniref:Uncharacterized protein n=1 Tax=Kingdonia uniflora TaxID=39325 RepID=A0A7J7P381_9MAGN|nr:hypothetical protein GIB67_039860 [Kingdonia uniflora]
MFGQRRLLFVVVDVTMTPKIPLRPISLWVVIADPFFAEVENKGISQYVVTPQRLDGATETQEGICVSFGCHALRQVVIILCVGCVSSSCVSVSRIILASKDNILSPYLTAIEYINNFASAGPRIRHITTEVGATVVREGVAEELAEGHGGIGTKDLMHMSEVLATGHVGKFAANGAICHDL